MTGRGQTTKVGQYCFFIKGEINFVPPRYAMKVKKTAKTAVFWFYITTMFFDLKSVFKLSGNSWSVISTLISSTFAKV